MFKKKANASETNAMLHFVDKTLLGDVFVCLCVLAIFSGIVFSMATLNNLFSWKENKNLNYNIFWLQQTLAPLGLGLIGVLLITKKKTMRNILVKELYEIIKDLNCIHQ